MNQSSAVIEMGRMHKFKKLKISIIWIYNNEDPEIAPGMIQEVIGKSARKELNEN